MNLSHAEAIDLLLYRTKKLKSVCMPKYHSKEILNILNSMAEITNIIRNEAYDQYNKKSKESRQKDDVEWMHL